MAKQLRGVLLGGPKDGATVDGGENADSSTFMSFTGIDGAKYIYQRESQARPDGMYRFHYLPLMEDTVSRSSMLNPLGERSATTIATRFNSSTGRWEMYLGEELIDTRSVDKVKTFQDRMAWVQSALPTGVTLGPMSEEK